LDITWDGGKLTKVVLRSTLGNPCRLRAGDAMADLKTEAGKTYTFDGPLKLQ
jgi:alpha-L-fucosidase 2